MPYFFIVNAALQAPRRVKAGTSGRREYCYEFQLGDALFGVVFLAMGSSAIGAALFGGLPKLLAGPGMVNQGLLFALALLMTLNFGGIFLAVGVWCLFGHSGIVLDREAGTVTL